MPRVCRATAESDCWLIVSLHIKSVEQVTGEQGPAVSERLDNMPCAAEADVAAIDIVADMLTVSSPRYSGAS
jgi:hypothetical protein